MLGLPSENERVALTSDGVMTRSSKKWLKTNWESGLVPLRPDGLEHLVNLGPVEVRGRLLAAEKEIEQVVVGELHQQVEAVGFRLGERRRAGEQPLEQEVILEQAAPAAPAQLAESGSVDRPAAPTGCADGGGWAIRPRASPSAP